MSKPTPTTTPNPLASPPKLISVPRAAFDSVPGRRAIYIVAYAAFVLLGYGPSVFKMFGYALPGGLGILIPLSIATGAAYLCFAYQLLRTMRIMGYEWWMVIGAVSISVMLIPGAVVLAYLDRRIATIWDAADPAGGYRQRPHIPKE